MSQNKSHIYIFHLKSKYDKYEFVIGPNQLPECIYFTNINNIFKTILLYLNDEYPDLYIVKIKSCTQYEIDKTKHKLLTNKFNVKSIESLDLFFVNNPEYCIDAVKYSGLILYYITNQTHQICISAVSNNGLALQFVKNQTYEICIAAVKNNGFAFQYINIEMTPTQKNTIYNAAIQQNNDVSIVWKN